MKNILIIIIAILISIIDLNAQTQIETSRKQLRERIKQKLSKISKDDRIWINNHSRKSIANPKMEQMIQEYNRKITTE